MVSDASKKKAAAKKAAAAAKRGGKAAPGKANGVDKNSEKSSSANGSTADLTALIDHDRSCTGVLASHPQSRDIHVSSTFASFCYVMLSCSKPYGRDTVARKARLMSTKISLEGVACSRIAC